MSNVCRYFLNNTCRYGNRCRFSHNVSESGSASSGSSNNPYVYIRDHRDSPQNWKRNLSNTEIREIIDRIAEEANQVEYEHMWPLTCLSVLRDAPNVPGWEDYSMEEIRAAAYASKAAGRFDEYLDFFMGLQQKAKENRAIFLRPGKTAEDVVRSMFNKNNQQTPVPPTSASKSQFPFTTAQISNFDDWPSSTSSAPRTFGAPGFGSQASSKPGMASSPFGSASSSKDSSDGIFAMAARGFSQSSFNQSQISSMNDTDMETATDVSLSQNAMPPFHQNIFGQVPQPSGGTFKGTAPSVFPSSAAPSIFASSAAPSGFSSSVTPSAGPPSTLVHLSAVFTPMDQLTEMELEQFKATTFTLDKLPLRPPPRELC